MNELINYMRRGWPPEGKAEMTRGRIQRAGGAHLARREGIRPRGLNTVVARASVIIEKLQAFDRLMKKGRMLSIICILIAPLFSFLFSFI
jgi:hypothetical protein